MVMSFCSKRAAGKARGGSISEWICNRRATRPPAYFKRNPPGRGRLAVSLRCSLLTYQSKYARRSLFLLLSSEEKAAQGARAFELVAALNAEVEYVEWQPSTF
jgi:hypothetical protein